jgi:sporulation protein YlmC with PRC-barrel domain
MMFGEGDGTYLANSFLGAEVYDANGLEIGKVYDFVADEDGRVEYVVVKHGGSRLLGIGSRLTPVPLDAATVNPSDHTIKISSDKDRFMEAPMIGGNNWSRFDDAAWNEKIQEHFE